MITPYYFEANFEKFVSLNEKGETRMLCTKHLKAVLTKTLIAC